MRFDSELQKKSTEVIEKVFGGESYSLDDFTFEVEGDGLNISVLDKVRLISKMAELVGDSDKELDFGIEMINRYLDKKQIVFYKGKEQIGNIVYDARSGFDAFPVFKAYPVLIQIMSARLVAFISKNSLGCMMKKGAQTAE